MTTKETDGATPAEPDERGSGRGCRFGGVNLNPGGRMTEEELREIENATNEGADFRYMDDAIDRLVAEVRRLRGLFSEEDARLLEAAAFDWDSRNNADPQRLGDLAHRIREAIGHPPTDSDHA